MFCIAAAIFLLLGQGLQSSRSPIATSLLALLPLPSLRHPTSRLRQAGSAPFSSAPRSLIHRPTLEPALAPPTRRVLPLSLARHDAFATARDHHPHHRTLPPTSRFLHLPRARPTSLQLATRQQSLVRRREAHAVSSHTSSQPSSRQEDDPVGNAYTYVDEVGASRTGTALGWDSNGLV